MVKVEDKPQGAPPVAPTREQAPISRDAREKAEERDKKVKTEWPAEGPHARADLTNEEATPGSGLFSTTAKPGGKVDPGAG